MISYSRRLRPLAFALNRSGLAATLLLAALAPSILAAPSAHAQTTAPLMVSSLVSSPSTVVNGATATGTIILSAPAGTTTDQYGNQYNGVTVVVNAKQSGYVTFLNTKNADGSTVNVDQVGNAYVFIPTGNVTGTFQYTAGVVMSNTPVSLGASLNGVLSSKTVTIAPTDPAAVTITPSPVYNGNTTSVTVTLASPAYESEYSSGGTTSVSPGASVNINISNPSAGFNANGYYVSDPDGSYLYTDYSGLNATLIIPAGHTTATFTLNTSPVTADQHVTISALEDGKTVKNTFTITPSMLSSIAVSPAPVVAGGTAEGTVTLSAPADAYYGSNGGTPSTTTTPGELVTVTTSDPTITFPGSGQYITNADGSSYYVDPYTRTIYLTIPQGSTIGTFALAAGAAATKVPVYVTASLYNSRKTALVSVLATKVATNTVTTSTLYNGNSSTGTVMLTSPAVTSVVNNQTQQGITVELNSSNAAVNFGTPYTDQQNADGSSVYVIGNGIASLFIPTGHTSGTYSLSTTNVPVTTTSVITASLGGVNKGKLITVTPTLLSGLFTSGSTTLASGQSSTLTATLNGPAVSYTYTTGQTSTVYPGVTINLAATSPAVTFQALGNATLVYSAPGFAVLYLPVGSTSGSVTATNTGVSASTPATISAALYGSNRTATLTLNP